MEDDPTRMCELLVGLGDVEVLGVDGEAGTPLGVHIRRRAGRPLCPGSGGPGGWGWPGADPVSLTPGGYAAPGPMIVPSEWS